MAEVECPRFRSLLGCHFEPRYDKSEPFFEGKIQYTGSQLAERIEQHRRLTYIRDICTRCGKVIEREKCK